MKEFSSTRGKYKISGIPWSGTKETEVEKVGSFQP